MNHQLLGTLAMLGAPMLLAESLLRGLGRGNGDPIIAAVEVLYIGGWICGAIGMRRLRATGDSPPAAILFGVQLAGLLMALAFSVIEPFSPDAARESILIGALDISWPLSHILMIVVGIAVLVAGRWPSPWKLAPLLCGLALPVSMLGGSAIGMSKDAMGLLFGGWTAVSFSMVGFAVRNAPADAHGAA